MSSNAQDLVAYKDRYYKRVIQQVIAEPCDLRGSSLTNQANQDEFSHRVENCKM